MDHMVIRNPYYTQQYNPPPPTMLRIHSYGGPPMAYVLHNNNDSRSNYDNLVNYYRSLLGMSSDGDYTNNGRDRSHSRRLSGNEAGGDLRFSAEAVSRNFFKTRRYGEKGSERDRGEKDVCAVCLDEYEENQRVGALQCGHEYHAECINKWLLGKNTCPTCRAPAWR